MSKPDWVFDTHSRTARGDIEPVEMRNPRGRAPMMARHVRAVYNTATGALTALEVVGERLATSRYGHRSATMTRRVDPTQLDAAHVPKHVRDFVEKHRPVVLGRYLVTIKLRRDSRHDPRNKQTGICPVSPYCTDVTGEHHTMLIEASDEEHAIRQASALGSRITRIERVPVAAERAFLAPEANGRVATAAASPGTSA